MRQILLRALTVVVVMLGAGCALESETNLTAPSASPPAPIVSGLSPEASALVGVWALQDGFSLPDPSACGNFEWQIASQSETALSGSFTATCGGSISLSARTSGERNGDSVTLKLDGVALVGGLPLCPFSLSGTGTVVNGDTLTLPWSGTTCLGPVQGTETLRKKSNTPAPPPESPTSPQLPPPSTPSAPGGFDLSQVKVLASPNVLVWPVTSQITSIGFSLGTFSINHTRRGQWPPVAISSDGTQQEATIWIFFRINGQWYATGAERLRPSQFNKPMGDPWAPGVEWLYDPNRWGPMTNYQPQPGELVG